MTRASTQIIGLSVDKLIDRPHFETVRERMGRGVFAPALREVVRQLWKLARGMDEAEELGAARRRVKQILVISDRFGLMAVNRRAQAIMRATANFPREGASPPESEPLWEKLREALWDSQALIESGRLDQEELVPG
ncbi:hypothetical protein KAJ83_09530 [Marivibrio halodurans]|uniref:Uncharacterized protein n=1 Tax=Marivibrio halodurans TaxID=2039722 RepID=A0A8J7S296_9PROT|nr:hypothetical protein [Marivibrio halodurans]MBP5857248.1 hypothetical protein [Marivibrio halodurans]